MGRVDVQVQFDAPLSHWEIANAERSFGFAMRNYDDFVRSPVGVFNRSVTYEEAEYACEEFGGHLASIHTDEELVNKPTTHQPALSIYNR